MDSLKRRNSPKTPFMEIFDAEILHSPYREGEVEGSFRSGPTPDLFGLEQQQPRAIDRVRAAGGVAFMARDLRDVLREL